MKILRTFHEDPGHGWLEIPMGDLYLLKIRDHISPCSYYKPGANHAEGGIAFLEEDLDAGTFMNAAKAAGWEVSFKEAYEENTPIRKYPSYPSHPDWEALSGWKTAA